MEQKETMTSAPTDPSKGKLLTAEELDAIFDHAMQNWLGGSQGHMDDLRDHIAAQAALLDQAETALKKVWDFFNGNAPDGDRHFNRLFLEARDAVVKAYRPSPDEEGK